MTNRILIPLALIAASGTASATILAFGGGDTTDGLITGSPGNSVVDFGYKVPATNSTDPVLFETGGDGIGFMLAHIGTTLRVFQDQNAGDETALSLDIAAFAGQTVSIRLDGNFTPANGARIISLDVVPSSGTAVNIAQMDITSSDPRLSGSDGTGFGGIFGSLSGNGEAASGVQGFDVAARDVAGPGSSVLGPGSLVGTIYSGADANAHRLTAIPSADSYTFVPEPSSALLLLLSGLGMVARRRR